jgi:predicted nuclease of predicted toxin-antitoxin system
VDHCVPVEVAEFLRQRGHEAWTAFEAHLQTAGDDDLNIYADAKDAILVTVNKDCAAIARRLQAASVVYLRVRERDAVQAAARAEAWLQANHLPKGRVLRVPKQVDITVMRPLPW